MFSFFFSFFFIFEECPRDISVARFTTTSYILTMSRPSYNNDARLKSKDEHTLFRVNFKQISSKSSINSNEANITKCHLFNLLPLFLRKQRKSDVIRTYTKQRINSGVSHQDK